ncbi:MAG: hypothetical protein Q8M56_06880 [Desulfobacterales bacterium]|nr:hypothetical protein [Desulfobacterales bacterium]
MNFIWRKVALAIKFLWIFTCVTILLILISDNEGFKNSEAMINFVRSMIAITFPSGLGLWTILSLKTSLLPGVIISKEVDIIIRWLGFVIVGYFQWFYFVPRVYYLLKKAGALVLDSYKKQKRERVERGLGGRIRDIL